MCPPTPPPEMGEEIVCETAVIGHKDDGATDGNSAAALNQAQDRSLYITPEGLEKETLQDSIRAVSRDNEKDKGAREDGFGVDTSFKADAVMPDQSTADAASMPTPESVAMDTGELFCTTRISEPVKAQTGTDPNDASRTPQCRPPSTIETSNEHKLKGKHGDLPVSNKAMDHVTNSSESSDLPTTPRFDFSKRRLYPQYPSSFLRPGSKFSGTQQSERQIYNVDVQVLTLSVPEATMTGYLRICGLTEDHPTLTTFFTGEIIGGPTHKHTFQTKDASWGATDRTDLQHWARFPAWRPLSKDAKRDINFNYPPPATRLGPRPMSPSSVSAALLDSTEDAAADDANPGWWTQPNIFMRWKEWFLVPDHRVRSIQGASFEGFYYICFNQVEGKVNGIYFHAKSEK
jgi:Vacuolar import and degradation protein